LDERGDCWDKRGLEGYVRLLYIGLGFVTRDLPRAAAADALTYSWESQRAGFCGGQTGPTSSIAMLPAGCGTHFV
jgi:hypothetical protein